MMIALYLSLGAIGLYYGAEWLIRGSSSLALRYGVAPLVVGLTVVAFGTSAPEMVVSVTAALDGFGSIAVGNVVGSNIFNVAVILGLAALLRPVHINPQILKMDGPLVVVASLVFVLVMMDGLVTRLEAAFLFLGILGYVGFTVYQGKKKGVLVSGETLINSENVKTASSFQDVLFILGGLLTLVLGSHLFVEGAVDLAELMGVSQAIIALTIVALGTSLPELATTVVASVRKESDIAVGNIIGSNLFNILAILGASGLVSPLRPEGIGQVDILVMVGLSLILLPLMRRKYCLGRWEGAFFLLVYVAYLFYLWPKGTGAA
jgi:cation:H+ antiporter